MRKWQIAWAVASVAAILVLLSHSSSPGLLHDTDTAVLLRTIKAKNAPFIWFWSDWPLYNHFYRPIPTLSFEWDSRLFGTNPAGYGWTNAALAAACVLALFWFLRELVDRPVAAAGGTVLFATWQWKFVRPDWNWIFYFGLLTGLVGLVRHWDRSTPKQSFKTLWPVTAAPALVGLYFSRELMPIEWLGGRVIDWLPGRTASCMTLFALGAMATYARYERLGPVAPTAITPLTPPATRSTTVSEAATIRWPWALLSFALAAGAFASYEQAVMLPACLLGVAIVFAWRGYKPSWFLHIGFWGLLAAYLGVRHAVIPAGVSRYQKQQLRTTASALGSLETFVWPLDLIVPTLQQLADQGWPLFLSADIYWTIGFFASAVESVWELRREWINGLAGILLSILAFLPMAWLKFFEHYYYWPEALRTVFAIALGSVFWRLVSISWRPPELQAPPRLSPAPGSLPRR